LLRDAKARSAPAENSRDLAIAGPGRLPFDRPLEGQGRDSVRQYTDVAPTSDSDTKFKSSGTSPIPGGLRKEAGDVVWQKLHEHRCPKFFKAELPQILVEVTEPGR